MKNPLLFSIPLWLLTLTFCETSKSKEAYIEEVRATELAFSAAAQEKGVKEAFLQFAADDCVLMRRNQVFKGKDSIVELFANFSPTATLEWSPDFVDVSTSGDLAYTYGPYTFRDLDSLGNPTRSTGIFHTVWKRQSDGTWKFVWD